MTGIAAVAGVRGGFQPAYQTYDMACLPTVAVQGDKFSQRIGSCMYHIFVSTSQRRDQPAPCGRCDARGLAARYVVSG